MTDWMRLTEDEADALLNGPKRRCIICDDCSYGQLCDYCDHVLASPPGGFDPDESWEMHGMRHLVTRPGPWALTLFGGEVGIAEFIAEIPKLRGAHAKNREYTGLYRIAQLDKIDGRDSLDLLHHLPWSMYANPFSGTGLHWLKTDLASCSLNYLSAGPPGQSFDYQFGVTRERRLRDRESKLGASNFWLFGFPGEFSTESLIKYHWFPGEDGTEIRSESAPFLSFYKAVALKTWAGIRGRLRAACCLRSKDEQEHIARSCGDVIRRLFPGFLPASYRWAKPKRNCRPELQLPLFRSEAIQ